MERPPIRGAFGGEIAEKSGTQGVHVGTAAGLRTGPWRTPPGPPVTEADFAAPYFFGRFGRRFPVVP